MSHDHDDYDPYRRERRRILRRAALYTYGFLVAAILVAVVGAAAVAWILSFAGLPFGETWLVLSVVILAVPVIGRIVEALRERAAGKRMPGGEDDGGGPEDGAG